MDLSSRARAHLRALAHPLKPLVQVGVEGVTESVCRAVSVALEDHELVKVKLTQGFQGDRSQAAGLLAEGTRAHVAQMLGRVVLLYRRRAREDRDRPRIQLP